jgi:hypothetical protein
MSFEFRHLMQLERGTKIPLPTDDDGLVGRECPEPSCLGYFKVRFGTGLTGRNLPCHCPYCGQEAPQNNFWTPEQLAYIRSQAKRTIAEAIGRDLKQLEFDQPARGPFGISVSMKLVPGTPIPIRYYREKALETPVTCSSCTLDYAIYGLFAFCPDCGTHNSKQILEKNLSMVGRQVALADKAEDAAFRRHLLEDALENCVSSLDGFGRETCRVRAARSTAPDKCDRVSFQNLARVAERLNELFGIDLPSALETDLWKRAHLGFMKRHLVSHRAGVVDQKYIDETQDTTAVVGRLIPLGSGEIIQLADATMEIGSMVIQLLPAP